MISVIKVKFFFLILILQLVVLCVAIAAINAQYLAPSYTTQNQNIYRSPYNLGQVSTHSKTIDTPFSSVSKSDVRVSNPGLALGGLGYGHGISPLGLAHGISPLGVAHGIAPLGLAPRVVGRPAVVSAGAGLLGVAYSASPAVSHMSYSNGLGLTYAW